MWPESRTTPMRLLRRLATFGAGTMALSAACGRSASVEPPARPPEVPTAAVSTAAASASGPTLPPGVLAESQGVQGVVRVEQRDGLLLMTIDGVVQGTARQGAGEVETSGDPLVEVARTVRPRARSALLLGLGTGATARQLARAGLQVEVAELEPSVVEYARRFFGYQGHAAVSDGLDYARSSTRQFDLVVVDAFDARQPAQRLVRGEAIDTYRRRRSAGGVTLVRTLGRPGDAEVRQLWRSLGDRFQLAFGSGAGSELQNMVVLGSSAPMTVADGTALSIWPVDLRGSAGSEGDPTGAFPGNLVTEASGAGRAERELVVTGYLVRDPSGVLFVDIPHDEMGGVRYALDDASAAAAAHLLPSDASYPTQGDIGSDGDPSGTLWEAMGGGGAKRSDVRFSPIVVKVRGTARLRAVIDPDAWMGPPRKGPGSPWNPLLPYGGVLYEIRDASVVWSLQASAWRAARRRTLEPVARKATASLGQGRIAAAADQAGKYVDGAVAALGEPVGLLAAVRDMGVLRDRLREEAERMGESPGPGAIAAACDRVAQGAPGQSEGIAPDAAGVRASLDACARRFYERSAMQETGEGAKVSARRLVGLLQGAEWENARLVERLRARFGDLEPLDAPPPAQP